MLCFDTVELKCGGVAALTLAVPVIPVSGGIMLAESLQDELVVHQTLDGFQQEGVEGQVAHLLQLKLFVDRLQLLQPLGGLLQLSQNLVVFLQVAGKFLQTKKQKNTKQKQRRRVC